MWIKTSLLYAITVDIQLYFIQFHLVNLLINQILQTKRKYSSYLIRRKSIFVDNRINSNYKRRKSRSFDEYRFSKCDLGWSYGLILFEAKMIRRFEHPTFQSIYKEIELNFYANCAYDRHLTNSICPQWLLCVTTNKKNLHPFLFMK
jgi:hypothetical protein